MRILDTIKLAKTKFRIRRIRLSIGIILLVLLLSAVLSAFVVLNNIASSIKGYTNTGINGRYLVAASNKKPYIQYENPPQDFLDSAMKYYNEGVAKEKAAYQKFGYEYVEDPSHYPYTTETYNNREYKYINYASPYTMLAIEEYAKQFSEYTKDDLANIARPYHPLNIYTDTWLSTTHGRTFVYTNGKENFLSLDPNNDNDADKPLEGYFNQLSISDDDVIKAFLLDDFKLETDEIPIVIGVDQAELLLNLKPLKNTNTDQERWERLNYIRGHANAEPYQVCYRNTASINQISTAYLANIDRNTKITYNIPTTGCDLPTIKVDNRTETEKTATTQHLQQQTTIQKELGTYSEPHQQFIKYRIVGIVPDNQTSSSTPVDAFGLLEQLISAQFAASNPIVPKSSLENNLGATNFAALYSRNESGHEALWPKTSYIAEFTTPEDAQAFLANYDCGGDYDGVCKPDKPFMLTLFGNNSVLIDQFFNNITNILIGAILAIAALALIILFNIINRILADSQKETAVFRAIGYRKSHITKIYLAYIAIYSLIVYTLAILITAIVPWIINAIFSEKLGLYFSVFFDAKEYTPFNFASFEPLTLLIIFPILLIGLIAAAIPLIINSRRNIIKNLRQE